jgi:hypothetical protein
VGATMIYPSGGRPLAGQLGVELADAETQCQGLAAVEASLDREAFRDAAQAVNDRLVARPEDGPARERLATLRDEAWRSSLESAEVERALRTSAPAADERYLNAEFVAIYW